jgi:hypothetical protein
MPRVENCGANVETWCESTGNGSSTHDVCKACARLLERNPHSLRLQPYNGDPVGTDGWVGEIDHPEYAGEDYSCEGCGRKLTSRDD